ncbi:hypothetical protein RhiirA4_548212 [Rhizophagus irregularis]|uniref:Uncharacterized protein n=1 Tax=Rhizophagus irregularis TaxID=588596 RepID=A0A2I1H6B0_9GLOM|nr:hypothetical protein RhiirA4_548212 [Rhizophagus irregularis]
MFKQLSLSFFWTCEILTTCSSGLDALDLGRNWELFGLTNRLVVSTVIFSSLLNMRNFGGSLVLLEVLVSTLGIRLSFNVIDFD